MPKDITINLSTWISEYSKKTLHSDVYEAAMMRVLDTIGLVVQASEEKTTMAAYSFAACKDLSDSSVAIWNGKGSGVDSVMDATLINSIAAHAHFHDDSDHPSWTHPASLIIPGVFALSEKYDLSLSDAVRGIAIGYAVINWLGADHHIAEKLIKSGLRTSPTLGTIAAAASAAATLGLNADQTKNAISLATSYTGGILEPVLCGSDDWKVQNGRAAHGGVVAALLAMEGVVGTKSSLDGKKGFLATYIGSNNVPTEWLRDPDIKSIKKILTKPFATLGDNMPAACAALDAYEKIKNKFDAKTVFENIESVVISLWRPYTDYPGTSYKGPYEFVTQAQASTVFAVATILKHGDLTYEITKEFISDSELSSVLNCSSVIPHDNNFLDSEIKITLKNGTVIIANSKEHVNRLVFPDKDSVIKKFVARLAGFGFDESKTNQLAVRAFADLEGKQKISATEFIRSLFSK